MIRQHHRLNGHEFEQTLRDSGGQRSLACCSPGGCRVGCKESACNAGDPALIPGSGRSPGSGNPLQYSCLGSPLGRGTWQATVHGVARVVPDLASKTTKPTVSLMLTKGIHPPLNNEQIHISNFCICLTSQMKAYLLTISAQFSVLFISKKILFYFVYPLSPALLFFFSFIFISWRLITSQHFSGFCHTYPHLFNSISHLLSLPHNLTF